MVQEGQEQRGVADHPMVLTAMILYSIVAGFGLAEFPPVSSPQFTDALRFSVLLLLLGRIVLTYAYASKVHAYTGPMFLLEATVAVAIAWQLRLLDSVTSPPSGTLCVFYGLHLFLVALMFVWNRLARFKMRFVGIRLLGIAAPIVGLLVEFAPPDFLPWIQDARTAGRWTVALILLFLAAAYIIRRPWELPGRPAAA